jgi:hypothetical protein
MKSACVLACLLFVTAGAASAQTASKVDYRVLATSKTSTLEKEMNEAAQAGFRFAGAMGGETAIGGKEAVAVMSRVEGGERDRYEYKLLATNRTSTMQRELREAAERGFEYRGQTVFETMFGGEEVVCILERTVDHRLTTPSHYLLVSTTKTSTLQKELQEAGLDGYEVLGLTVGKTAIGGNELVAILRRPGR